MSIWFALFKKELRLGWMAFIIFLVLQLLMMGIGIFMDMRFDGGAGTPPAVISVMLTVCLLFYVPVYLLFNTIQERKTFHLWLQNPLPAWSVLLAKLSGAIVYLVVTSIVVGSYTWVSLLRLNDFPQELSLSRIAVLAVLILLWCGIGGGVTFLFLWTVQRTMRSRIGKWSWLVLIVGIGIYLYIDTKLTQSGVVDFLTNWGQIPDSSLINFVTPKSTGTPGVFSDVIVDSSSLYVGSLVFDLLITVIVFSITAWLTDHELEAS
ncbi:hypothetical protein ABWW58_07470 [Sporolactobacillus sp. STCC-11]|uniref:hypothetical protein n=1 Tax=Sporolactobacillus caesalpiniae TaxID=3230362 RepID=UPI00339651B2